jgi:hypothetical protein
MRDACMEAEDENCNQRSKIKIKKEKIYDDC